MHQRMLRSSLLMCTKIRVFSESASRCTGRPYRGHQRKADIFGPDDRQGWYIVWRNCEYRAAMHRLFSFNHCIMPYISHFTIQFVLQSDKICLLNQCGGTDSLSLAVYPTTCISFLWHNCQRHLTVPNHHARCGIFLIFWPSPTHTTRLHDQWIPFYDSNSTV